MMKRALKHISVPGLLLVNGFAAFLTIRLQLSYELAVLAIFLFTSASILLLERAIPLKSDWKAKRQEAFTDVKYLLSTPVFDVLGKSMALWLILFLHRLYAPDGWWGATPFILDFVLANLIGEFLPYVYHRVSHVGKTTSQVSLFFWKVHAVHHLPVSLNWFKTNWMHPVNMFLNTFLKYGPLFLLGFNEQVIFSVGVTHVVIAYLSHANIDARTGVWDYLIVTPKIHQFHHSKKLEEAKNFGNILPFWDLILGTYYSRKGEVENVGLVEANYDYPHQRAFIKQIMFPLYARKDCCATRDPDSPPN